MPNRRLLILVLCLCLVAFKGISAPRFVETAMVRAHVYAHYQDPLSYMVSAQVVENEPQKIDASMMVSFHLPGILFLCTLGFYALALRNYQRPVIRSMRGESILGKIFRPPKLMV
jgi:hypothetical protein